MDRLLIGLGLFVIVLVAAMVLWVQPGEAQSGGVTYPPDLGRVSGILPIANGGTGGATATANTVFGNATSGSAAPAFGQIVNGQITNSTIDLTAKVTGVLPAANGGSGGAVLTGWCNGTVGTANATVYILSPYATVNTGNPCTVTSVAVEMPMPMACTAKNLRAISGTGGGAAGSGVVTAYVGGSTSILTCTMGTGTSCSDVTHSVAITAGQGFSLRILTGQATDTTANIKASFQCQ